MKRTSHDRLYPAEAALLLAMTAAMLSGAWAQARQAKLAEGLVRLHVIAVSDREADQAVKLRVRDAVLAQIAPALEDITEPAEARAILESRLQELADTAGRVSGENVEVSLGRELYPRREYDTFSLPAGEYLSLRVKLGAGRGHNWWCVVYPPLCTAVSTEELRSTAALDRQDVKLITRDGAAYALRFRVVDWWQELFSRPAGKALDSGTVQDYNETEK